MFSWDLLLGAVVLGVLLGCFYAAVSVGLSIAFGLLDVPQVAHPAFLVDDLAGLTAVLTHAGYAIAHDKPLEGYDRIFVDDPFGNRIELMEVKASPPV